jgi:hypothetical protein
MGVYINSLILMIRLLSFSKKQACLLRGRISDNLLATLTRILQREFRVKPRQPPSKPRLVKTSQLEQRIRSAAKKTRLRPIADKLPKALRSLLESKKVCTILYTRFRCEAIHGATIVLNSERFFSEKQIYWAPVYSDYHGDYEFLEFPGQFLLGCLESCINTYRHHLKAKGKIPPNIHFHIFRDIVSELDLLDREFLPTGGSVRLKIK